MLFRSLAWVHLLSFAALLALARPPQGLDPRLAEASLLPHGLGLALVLVCGLQFSLSLLLDRPYDTGLRRISFWMIWYPTAYWLLTFATTLLACWRLPLGSRGARARWISPDRGVRE